VSKHNNYCIWLQVSNINNSKPEFITLINDLSGSQGAGLLHNTIPKLDAKVKAKIAGIVVFGDTYQVKDSNSLPTYPKEKFKAFCSTTDLVCHDVTAKDPIILPAHIMYSSDVPEATNFFKKMISAAK
jgi:cutinase